MILYIDFFALCLHEQSEIHINTSPRIDAIYKQESRLQEYTRKWDS